MVTDTIADLLTRIRNAQMARHKLVKIPASKENANILNVLKSEGFIEGYQESELEGKAYSELKVFLRYDNLTGQPQISNLTRVSKPGRRIYSRKGDLPRVLSGLGIALVSTSKGVMTDREARRQGIGGEVLATVF